jgi:putative endonuclease
MDSKQLGILGERIAEICLKDKGYQILDKNYSSKSSRWPLRGEVDITAKKNDIISFIEVKALQRVQGQPFSPEEKVNFLKQRKLVKTAESWLMRKKVSLNYK